MCPAEPVNKTPTWPRLREQKAAASLALRRGGRRAEDFHRPPAAERRLFYQVCAGGGAGREGGEGGRQQPASQRLPQPGAAARGRGGEGRGREGKGREKEAGGGLGAARTGCGAQLAPVRGLRGLREHGPARRGLPGREALLAAQPGRRGPCPWDSGEPVLNDRTIWLLV